MRNKAGINGATWISPSDEIIHKIQKLYDEGFGGRKRIARELQISESLIATLLRRKLINFWRTKSEMLSIAGKKRVTPEHVRNKISQSRKKYLEEHPDQVPYKLNHKSRGESYPEKYFREWLEKENISFKQEYHFGLYSFDFLINDFIDLEIDGSQHYVDGRIRKSDEKRDKKAQENGFVVYRINWPEYQQLDDKESFLLELKQFIKNTSLNPPTILPSSNGKKVLRKNCRGEKVIKVKRYTENKCKLCGNPLTVEQKTYCSISCQHKDNGVNDKKVNKAIKLLSEGNSFLSVAKEMGVSDNAIRKWLICRGINPKDFTKQKIRTKI